MNKRKIAESVARGTKSILNAFLYADANSASCIFAYQPMAPKRLEKFRKIK
ncbi:MAG: cyclic lactone autoinducer peptide [Lachnospiraceae bacterium]|nr:cyclic lactone autoinducer peptide [Lachnospiraceae bacterium]